MVNKIFWEDTYKKELKTRVKSIEEKQDEEGNKNYVITLEDTIIYAFSGGQASDSATINGINVLEAREKKENNEIYYFLEKKPDFKVGDEIELKIDWKKRYKIMKLHSAAHVVHEIFSKKTGITKSIGSNIRQEKARLDYESENPISEFLPEIEAEANKIFSENHPVEIDEKNDGTRIWKSMEIKLPCGGTHVKNLNEIGKIKLKRKNIGKGKERIEIKLVEE